jgi:RNA polymerase sigma factor (sigma-70 family)
MIEASAVVVELNEYNATEEIDNIDAVDEEEEIVTDQIEYFDKTKVNLISEKSNKSIVKYNPTNKGLAPSEQNQEELFRELVGQYQKRLYRFVIKYIDQPEDAADITQQAFVEAARTIENFRGDSKLSTWLFGLALNMVRNYLSRAPHRVYKFETDESLIGLPSPSLDPSDYLIQKELLILVEKIFSDLPIEMSEVLSLVAIDEISYQDAADQLAIPLGTVRSRVSRARAVMRDHFNQAGVTLYF